MVNGYGRIRTPKMCCLSIDLGKKFDIDAILSALSALGFAPLFTKMLWNDMSSASFSLLIEGSPTLPFKNQRGIMQGDPLTPILFDMVMDVLSRLIYKELRAKRMVTYQVNIATSITHLSDILIFSKANVKSLKSMKGTLDVSLPFLMTEN